MVCVEDRSQLRGGGLDALKLISDSRQAFSKGKHYLLLKNIYNSFNLWSKLFDSSLYSSP
jgi:hypothetical protein